MQLNPLHDVTFIPCIVLGQGGGGGGGKKWGPTSSTVLFKNIFFVCSFSNTILLATGYVTMEIGVLAHL